MNKIKDIEITLRIRNNLLKERRLKLGFTQKELAEEINIDVSQIQAVECFNKKKLRPEKLIKICEYFKCKPEEIYPEYFKNIKKTSITRCLDAVEFISLTNKELLQIPSQLMTQEDECDKVFKRECLVNMLNTLKKRESVVIKHRFGINCESKTLEEVAQLLNVTKERVRQIEVKALKKLRYPNKIKLIDGYSNAI
jgi:RNA polymerase sigma factor (sigma-70 family)